MTEPAKLVARHLVHARLGETGAHLSDKARHHHRVDVSVGEQEAMHDIGAGQAELHRRVRRHADAMRYEIILFADQPHSSGAVGFDRGAEFALGELAAEMQGQRVDELDIARRVQRAGDPGDDDDPHHHYERRRHDHGPVALGAGDDLFRNNAVRERSLQRVFWRLSQRALAGERGGSRTLSSR